MYSVSVYGKGGVGKSTISSNISFGLSERGFNVLHVGCDPKHDSTRLLMKGVNQETFMDYLKDEDSISPLKEGSNGILCMECGGASPGMGCAGKGIIRMFDYLKENIPRGMDFRINDVLGDVVCGGFSVPMRSENADAVIIVISEEFMSLYAANNILRGMKNINDAPCLLGLVVNSRTPEKIQSVKAFSEASGLGILGIINDNDVFRQADGAGATVLEMFSESDSSSELNVIVDAVVEAYKGKFDLKYPKPLSDDVLENIITGKPVDLRIGYERKKNHRFESYDCERGLSYNGDYVMPSCTSHGAVELLQGISGIAVVLHGSKNCAYLMEYAYRRKILKTASGKKFPPGNLYSTGLDDDTTFIGDTDVVIKTIKDVIRMGFNTIFLVPTCTPVTTGTNLNKIADTLSTGNVRIVAVPEDDVFLGSKFGGYAGALKCLRELMIDDGETIPGTINILSFSATSLSRRDIRTEIERIIMATGLKPNVIFDLGASLEDVLNIPKAQYNIQLGDSVLSRKMSDVLLGGREYKALKMPNGMRGMKEWVSAIADMTGDVETGDKFIAAEEEKYRAEIESIRKYTMGRSAIIYTRPEYNIDWYLDTLADMGIEIKCLIYWKGTTTDHHFEDTIGTDIKRIRNVSLCDLKETVAEFEPDIVITGDSRVGDLGLRWVGFGTDYTGTRGAVYWAKKVRNAFRIPVVDGWRWKK